MIRTDRTRTVRTFWVYTYRVWPYAFGLAPLLSICKSCCLYLQMVQIKGEHNVYCLKWLCVKWRYFVSYLPVFFMSWGKIKILFMHWTFNLYVREFIKLLMYFVKYCNDVFVSLLKYFSVNLSISYLSFCFVEINTVCKSDRMTIPIRSDRMSIHHTVRTVRVRSGYSYGP